MTPQYFFKEEEEEGLDIFNDAVLCYPDEEEEFNSYEEWEEYGDEEEYPIDSFEQEDVQEEYRSRAANDSHPYSLALRHLEIAMFEMKL